MSDDTAFEIKSFLHSLTHRPGVYRMLDAKHKVIYVGKARDLKKRVSSYFHRSQSAPKTIAMLEQVARVEVTVANTEAEALILEYNLIKQHKPRFNVLLRDDKSYPYIRYDRAGISAFRLSLPRIAARKGAVFRAVSSTRAVRQTLEQLQKLFLMRQCKDIFFSPTAGDRACNTRSSAAPHRASALIDGDAYTGRISMRAMPGCFWRVDKSVADLVARMEQAAIR